MRKIIIGIFLLIALNGYGQEVRVNFGSLGCTQDGQKILFSAIKVKADWSDFNAENWVLVQYDLNTGKLSKISTAGVYGSYSPDGRKIAYEKRSGKNKADIYILDTETGKETRITDNDFRNFGVSWSPSGDKIVYNSYETGTVEIFMCDAHGNNKKQLTQSGAFKSYNPQWSPFGDYIVYYFEKGDSKDQIYLMNSNGENIRNLTNDTNHSYFPSWKDEKTVVFSTNDNEIHTLSIDGTTNAKVEGIKSFFAVYMKNGSKLFFINTENRDNLTVDVLDNETSKIRTLVTNEDLMKFLSN